LSIVLMTVVGDFITVDGCRAVEYVGLKTTRLRSLGGEQIVFSNTSMLKSRIHNYRRMQTRRIAFTIGVTYQTSAEKLRALPAVIGDIVRRQPNATFDRAHLTGFGASSLDFEVVYFVNSAEYQVYLDIQQALNLDLIDYFARESIDFAYPTQTIHYVRASAAPAVADELSASQHRRPIPNFWPYKPDRVVRAAMIDAETAFPDFAKFKWRMEFNAFDVLLLLM
jgi:small-conductance mechanosensitive channel